MCNALHVLTLSLSLHLLFQGVVYGILLNGYGGAVMGFGEAPRFASNVELESVRVHDFVLNPIEKCKFALSNSPFAIRGPVL